MSEEIVDYNEESGVTTIKMDANTTIEVEGDFRTPEYMRSMEQFVEEPVPQMSETMVWEARLHGDLFTETLKGPTWIQRQFWKLLGITWKMYE